MPRAFQHLDRFRLKRVRDRSAPSLDDRIQLGSGTLDRLRHRGIATPDPQESIAFARHVEVLDDTPNGGEQLLARHARIGAGNVLRNAPSAVLKQPFDLLERRSDFGVGGARREKLKAIAILAVKHLGDVARVARGIRSVSVIGSIQRRAHAGKLERCLQSCID